jgi:drug/metabolite transporter (DMT)-like permease
MAGGGLGAPHRLARGRPAHSRRRTALAGAHLSVLALLRFAYVGTVSTFYDFFAWYRGLAQAGIARASQTQLAQPLLTILWAVPLLGESHDPVSLLAALVVAPCVLVTQRSRAPDIRLRADRTVGCSADHQ